MTISRNAVMNHVEIEETKKIETWIAQLYNIKKDATKTASCCSVYNSRCKY